MDAGHDLVDQSWKVIVGGEPYLENWSAYPHIEERPVPGDSGHGTNTTFPTIRRSSRSAITTAASSSGRSAGIAGLSLPSLTIWTASSIRARFPAGSLPAHAPQSIPITLRLLRSTWLRGTDPIVPDVNPITHSRPNLPSALSAASLFGPPTGSITTATP